MTFNDPSIEMKDTMKVGRVVVQRAGVCTLKDHCDIQSVGQECG